MKFKIASDHAGREIKLKFIELLKELNLPYEDLSKENTSDDDYPDFADKVCSNLKKGELGFLACATGIGISISANKHKNIRAALIKTPEEAKLARAHNNANVLVLSGRHKYKKLDLKEIIKNFTETKFEGGRHKRRVDKLN